MIQTNDKQFKLPLAFDMKDRVYQELSLMLQYLQNQMNIIKSQEVNLTKFDQQFSNKLNAMSKIDHFIVDQVLSSKDIILSVLSAFNYYFKIPHKLENIQKVQIDNKNPYTKPPTIFDYIDDSKWLTWTDEKADQQNWIGHGYYWRFSDASSKDTIGCGDFDTLESNFFKINSSRVLLADYELIKKDFPFLAKALSSDIDAWLCEQFAFLSQHQLNRVCKSEGDLHASIELLGDSQHYFDSSCNKTGFRYKGGGRAVNFIVNDSYEIKDGFMKADFVNVKGVGTQQIAQESDLKTNGLLSLVDAYKEFQIQKMIQHISEAEQTQWSTVQTYAIIDIGMRYKKDTENPSTGYKGDALGLTIRQGHSRFQAHHFEPAFYSVISDEYFNNFSPKGLIECLAKYGVSSEQTPATFFKQLLIQQQQSLLANEIKVEEGSWNIQGDATATRFVDFSQYYVFPDEFSSLSAYWKPSKQAFLNGINCGRLTMNFKKALFGTQSEEEAEQKFQHEVSLIKAKHDMFTQSDYKLIGQAKPMFSWSWFLETDDSAMMKWAIQKGGENSNLPNYSQIASQEFFMQLKQSIIFK